MGPCSTHVVQPVLRSRSVLMQAVQSSGSRGGTQVSGGGVVRAQNNVSLVKCQIVSDFDWSNSWMKWTLYNCLTISNYFALTI